MDDYQDMASDPPHLRVRFEDGINPIRDKSPANQLRGQQTTGNVDNSDQPLHFQDIDIINCKNKLLFMKGEQKEYSTKVLELYTIAPNAVNLIHIWLSDNLAVIESTYKCTPIST